MGLYHNYNYFRKLQEYGDKLIKFKQYTSLKAATEGGMVEQPLVEHAMKGACTAFVFEWISGKLSGTSSYGRNQGVKSHANEAYRNLAAKVAPGHVRYLTDDANWWDASVTLAKEYSLEIIDDDDIEQIQSDDSFQEVWDNVSYKVMLASYKQKKWYYYMCMNCTYNGQKIAHALGVSHGEGHVHFFDPNIGEYKITKDGFIPEYLNLCATKLKHVYKEGGSAYRMKRIGSSD